LQMLLADRSSQGFKVGPTLVVDKNYFAIKDEWSLELCQRLNYCGKLVRKVHAIPTYESNIVPLDVR